MTEPIALSARQLHLLRHSLGLVSAVKPYRNFWAAGNGGPVVAELAEMCALGLMYRDPRSKDTDSLIYFHVSPSGYARLGVAPENENTT